MVGGGVTGLSFCHKLQQTPYIKTTLIESSSRLGGWIKSEKDGGALSERGPRSLITRRGEETVNLIEELSLDEQVIIANPDASKRFIWMNGVAERVPSGVRGFFSSKLTGKAAWSFVREPFRKAGTAEDESVYDFASRRVNEHFAKYLVDPLVAGIYAGDPKKLSARSCFGQLFELERKHGSVLRGIIKSAKENKEPAPSQNVLYKHLEKHGGIYSFQEGMETLPRALASVIPSTEVLTNTKLLSLSYSPQGSVRVRLRKQGREVEEEYDSVVSTLSALDLSDVLSRSSCSDPASLSQLAEQLKSIEHASVYVVNITYASSVSVEPGFGLLFPTSEGVEILGITFDSHSFPSQSPETRLTVMIGGARYPQSAKLSPEEAEMRALSIVKQCLNVSASPIFVSTYLATNCIPQYHVNHFQKVKTISELTNNCFDSNLAILGTALHGVSVNDCIATGRRHASNLMQKPTIK